MPYHKTDPFFCGTNILFMHQEIANSVSLLQEYVRSRDKLCSFHHALFLPEDRSLPTRAWFESKLFAFHISFFWSPFGIDRRCHFLCITRDIKEYYQGSINALGQWSSLACTIYVYENPCMRMALQLAILKKCC